AIAGYRGASFSELQRLGLAAEARMRIATGGVNTHRGAIFNLGLLAAAAAAVIRDGDPVTAVTLGRTVSARWGAAICAALHVTPSHGLTAAARYGAGGARLEAALGFPSVLARGVPTLRRALTRE